MTAEYAEGGARVKTILAGFYAQSLLSVENALDFYVGLVKFLLQNEDIQFIKNRLIQKIGKLTISRTYQ